MIFDNNDKKCNECRWLDHSKKCINNCSDYNGKDIKDIPVEGCGEVYPFDDEEVLPFRCDKTPMLDGMKL